MIRGVDKDRENLFFSRCISIFYTSFSFIKHIVLY